MSEENKQQSGENNTEEVTESAPPESTEPKADEATPSQDKPADSEETNPTQAPEPEPEQPPKTAEETKEKAKDDSQHEAQKVEQTKPPEPQNGIQLPEEKAQDETKTSNKQASVSDEISLGGPNFGGVYEYVSSENFEEFLGQNGANFMIRKLAAKSKPDLEIWQDNDHFTIKTVSTFMTKVSEFTLGQEYTEKQPNGVEFKCLSSWEDNKLVTTMEPKVAGNGKPQKVTRELNDTEFTLTMEVGDVVAKRTFKMVARQMPPDQLAKEEITILVDPDNPFRGKYKHISDDNFEGVLGAMGMPYLMRKVATKTSPDILIEQDGDNFKISMVSTFVTRKNEFKVGEEFEDQSPTGTEYKAVAVWEDDKLRFDMTPKVEGKGQPMKTYRELVGNLLHLRFEIGDVKGARIFERVHNPV